MRLLLLLFISAALAGKPVSANNGAGRSMPERIAFVYGRPLFDTGLSNVLSRIANADYDTTADTRRFSAGTSVWIYLPYKMLLKDTSRNLLVTGYQDRIVLYRNDKQGWKRIRLTGKYSLPDRREGAQRSFVKLLSITTIVLLLMKYTLSGDRAYAFHAGGRILFLPFFILLYCSCTTARFTLIRPDLTSAC